MAKHVQQQRKREFKATTSPVDLGRRRNTRGLAVNVDPNLGGLYDGRPYSSKKGIFISDDDENHFCDDVDPLERGKTRARGDNSSFHIEKPCETGSKQRIQVYGPMRGGTQREA